MKTHSFPTTSEVELKFLPNLTWIFCFPNFLLKSFASWDVFCTHDNRSNEQTIACKFPSFRTFNASGVRVLEKRDRSGYVFLRYINANPH